MGERIHHPSKFFRMGIHDSGEHMKAGEIKKNGGKDLLAKIPLNSQSTFPTTANIKSLFESTVSTKSLLILSFVNLNISHLVRTPVAMQTDNPTQVPNLIAS
ncbi:CFC_HP_G0068310.mRNA.1.CDS.1 [Saccharomyces cerevisiae]|nr:CFC_HP_G0068310.mRNA.1.CDS.1 [Saccharomyces cerevisiae]CAI6648445.1 CFC_HP_G0068310.mRNA.1.CDS.1 [Saccharomyces cerevisiae]